MIVTVFRARLKPEAYAEYAPLAARLGEIAKSIPGYVSHKRFTADDGERVTIVEFATEEGHRAWAMHPEHLAAKRIGRERFYTEYKVQVCRLQSESARLSG